MKALQIAVVDDMAGDRQWLEAKLEAYLRPHHISYMVSAFGSGEDFLAALERQWFDIVFMDIYMGGMTGVEAAQVLRSRDRDCKLVFLTTSEDFMRQGFALNSAHYLVKPVKDEEFWQAMENCRIKRECQVPFLDLSAGRKNLHIDTMDILYVDVSGRSVTVHTKEDAHSAGRSFQQAADLLLQDERFLMCNKGILVNMDFITGVEKNDFVLVSGERLPLAPRRRKELLARYHSYTFGALGGA